MEKIYTSVTDNTSAELGFKYQYLLAFILYARNTMNEDYFIQVEREGDICLFDGKDRMISIESKHSEENGSLTKSSSDFWKTIANIYKQEIEGKTYSKYELCTNREDLTGFNLMNSKKKMLYLKGVNRKKESYLEDALSNMSEKYIFRGGSKKSGASYIEIDEVLLENIINKFQIIQIDDNYFKLKIKTIKALVGLSDDDAQDIIDVITSKISELDNINSDRMVSIKQLNQKVEKLYYEKMGTPIRLAHTLPNEFKTEANKYIEALKEIGINEKNQEKAKLHYALATFNKFEYIQKSLYVAEESIEEYENQIFDYLEEVKEVSMIKKDSVELNYHRSQLGFSENLNIKMRNVDVTPLHHKGTSHILVENDIHSWRYDEN